MNNCGRRSLIRKPIRSVLINGMCIFEVSVRKANAEISAELTSHTSQNCTFSYNTNTSSLVFDVRDPLCVQYERLRHVVA